MFKSNFKFCKNKNNKEKYTAYNPHSIEAVPTFDNSLPDKYIGIASIDPGSTNLGMYIMFMYEDMTPETKLIKRFDLNEKDKFSDSFNFERYNEAIRQFDEYLHLFKNCHYILIETQMNKNPQMIRMSQHLITYMSIKLKDQGVLPKIIEISAELKTSLLQGPIGKKKGQSSSQAKTARKNYCKELCKHIFIKFKDPNIKIFDRAKKGQGKNKLDDTADTVCQAYAFLVLCQDKKWWNNFFTRKITIEQLLELPIKWEKDKNKIIQPI